MQNNISAKKFVVFIHRLYFESKVKKGGLDQVMDYLMKLGGEITLFEYPLDYRQTRKVRISRIKKGETRILKEFKMPPVRDSITWTLEVVFSTLLVFIYARGANYCITADPLTTLTGVILKKLGFVKYLYYHSVDYSTNRFSSKLMNKIYFILLKLGLGNANLVGVVTRKAQEEVKKFGVKEIVFIPNSPSFHGLDNIRVKPTERQRYSMVITCVSVSHKFLIHDLVNLTARIAKKYPGILLNVVGHFDKTDNYFLNMKKFIHANDLQKNVIFHGNVDRETNYKIIARSYVGLAFYDGNYSHVIFGDAIKIREYCALGLPVVADSHTTTAVEMAQNGCGLVTDNFDFAYDAILKLFEDDKYYLECSESSLRWAKENDKDKIMDNIVGNYFAAGL